MTRTIETKIFWTPYLYQVSQSLRASGAERGIKSLYEFAPLFAAYTGSLAMCPTRS